MELMVYCGLIGIIVLVAGQAYSDSVKFRVRSEAMVKSSSEANDAATLLIEDVSQLGAKHYFLDNVSGLNSNIYTNIDDGDHSSFKLNNNRDSIEFNKLVYDEVGRFTFAQKITWWKKDSKLYRSCVVIDKREDLSSSILFDCADIEEEPRTVLIVENVKDFMLIPGAKIQDGENGDGEDLFADNAFALAPRNDGNYMMLISEPDINEKLVKLSGFSTNYNLNTNVLSQVYLVENPEDETKHWNDCLGFTFEPFQTYAVSFQLQVPGPSSSITAANVNYMRNFQPEVDHIAVGFRTRLGRVIPELGDFLVYPSQSTSYTDHFMEFSTPQKITNACLEITFGIYSPSAYRGFLNVAKMAVYKRDEAKYDFEASVNTPSQKTKIKAFKLILTTSVKGEETTIEKIIPTPNNGTED